MVAIEEVPADSVVEPVTTESILVEMTEEAAERVGDTGRERTLLTLLASTLDEVVSRGISRVVGTG